MKQKILIVDDSATARAIFKACIAKKSQYEVIETASWREVPKLVETHHPVLVVLDYNMPEKIGTDIARMLIDQGVDTKFVLMSANTQQSVLDEIRELGFLGVLEKPISAEEVNALLEKIL